MDTTELDRRLDALCDTIDAKDQRLCAMVGNVDRERLARDAAALFEKFHLPEKRGTLFGRTLGVKDIINVAGMETGCGTALPSTLFTGPEAGCIDRLKRAGALVIGKTQTTEFACTDPGPTCNPLNPGHTPGGSSSGSAAAVAAGFCDFALGTQTIGSVIRPAAYCGVTGFKPTYDRVPMDGVWPFSKTVDTLGFFCKHPQEINDMAPALLDCWKTKNRSMEQESITLGVPDEAYLEQADDVVRGAFDECLDRLVDAGYRIERTGMFDNIAAINDVHQRLIAAEMHRVHSEFLPEYRELYRPLTIATIDRGADIDDRTLVDLVERRRHNMLAHKGAMDTLGVDFWLSPPTATLAPTGLASTGNPVMNLPFTHLGLPTVCLPVMAADNGLRHGLQMAAPCFYDEELARLSVKLSAVFDV